ncbi:MAG TPA: S8 family serine peptidase [Thermoanaerobaculia bacterium]
MFRRASRPAPTDRSSSTSRTRVTPGAAQAGACSSCAGAASSSSYLLDLLAPGYRVPTAYNLVGVGSASGTSFSAPHVAGAVALLRQIDPQMTPDAIEEVLESTGRPIVDSRNGITTPRLDLFAAVMKVRNWPVVRRRAVRK